MCWGRTPPEKQHAGCRLPHTGPRRPPWPLASRHAPGRLTFLDCVCTCQSLLCRRNKRGSLTLFQVVPGRRPSETCRTGLPDPFLVEGCGGCSGSQVVSGGDIGVPLGRSVSWLFLDSPASLSLLHSARRCLGWWLLPLPGPCVTRASGAPANLGWMLEARARNKVPSDAPRAGAFLLSPQNLPGAYLGSR